MSIVLVSGNGCTIAPLRRTVVFRFIEIANRSCKDSRGFEVACTKGKASLCPEGWDDLPLVRCRCHTLGRCPGAVAGPYPSRSYTDFVFSGGFSPVFLRLCLYRQKQGFHIPLSRAFLVGREHRNQAEASACLSAQSFTSFWLALGKTSQRGRGLDFFLSFFLFDILIP